VFLLWPDPPTVHRRRLPAAVKPRLWALCVEAKRVGARSAPGVPRVPTVRAAPRARATGKGVTLPTGKVAVTVLGGVAAAPGVRTAPASSVRLRPARELRRLFASPAFLGEGTVERGLVQALAAPDPLRAFRALPLSGASAAQARFAAGVESVALGWDALDAFWGDCGVTDFLRLRLCVGSSDAGPKPKVTWPSFFWWAGRRLAGEGVRELPLDLVPASAAALLSVEGPRRAFEVLLPVFVRTDLGAPGREAARRLALRCAAAGTFAPAMVRFLLPAPERRSGPRPEVEAAWEPALLALHAYRAAGHDAGLTHVAAAVVATVVRDQVAAVGRRAVPGFTLREWGDPPPTPEIERAHHEAAAALGALLTQHWWGYTRPWPEGWRGPEGPVLERRLLEAVGDPGFPPHDLFLDDHLAAAAAHALQGHVPSARATLAATRSAAAFAPARDRLARALERGAFDRAATPLVDAALSREFRGRLERLRHTPDPAEFGSPDWRRDDLRGRLLSHLQKDGRRGLALALRTLLGMAFADLDRFWLAPSVPDEAALVRLAAWLGRGAAAPSEEDRIAFLEAQCRASSA
jgi:hypothetical protein